MLACRSALNRRADKQTGRRVAWSSRRRARPLGRQKWQIEAETQEPGVSVPMVAQRYNLNANQIFRWRSLFRESERAGGAGRFVPVLVEAAPAQEPDPSALSTWHTEAAYSPRQTRPVLLAPSCSHRP